MHAKRGCHNLVLLVVVLDLLAGDGTAVEFNGSLALLLRRAQDAEEVVEGKAEECCCEEEGERIHGRKEGERREEGRRLKEFL